MNYCGVYVCMCVQVCVFNIHNNNYSMSVTYFIYKSISMKQIMVILTKDRTLKHADHTRFQEVRSVLTICK